MAKPKRHPTYIRIRPAGFEWHAYYGWTVNRHFAGDNDLAALIARCEAACPGEKIDGPAPEQIAAGLPPDTYALAYELIEWLEANPKINPAMLARAKAAIKAECTPTHAYPGDYEPAESALFAAESLAVAA